MTAADILDWSIALLPVLALTAGFMWLDVFKLMSPWETLGLLALGAFVMRQRMKFETQNLRYQKQLAETVYFRNLANNAGVLDLLIGAGEEQDTKEAFLAYWVLLRAGHAMGRGELDMEAEQFLKERLQLEVNFEIHDAIDKLERLGLVVREGENYRALPVRDALTKLDAAWDGYFNFSAQR